MHDIQKTVANETIHRTAYMTKTDTLNTFFAECSVAKQGSIQNTTNVDLLKIILWNNKAICVDGKSVYYNKLANKGIFRIGDLISKDNKLLTNNLQSHR